MIYRMRDFWKYFQNCQNKQKLSGIFEAIHYMHGQLAIVYTFQPSMGHHSNIIIMSFLVTFVSGYITQEGSNDVNVMSYCDIAK